MLTYLDDVKYLGPGSLFHNPSWMYPLPRHRYKGRYA